MQIEVPASKYKYSELLEFRKKSDFRNSLRLVKEDEFFIENGSVRIVEENPYKLPIID